MVELVRVRRKPGKLAKEFGCRETSISAWVRKSQADERGGGIPDARSNTAERQEFAQQCRQLRQVTLARDILAKATARQRLRQDIYALIQANQTNQALCQHLAVSASGYYEWFNRAPSQRSIQGRTMTEQIRQIHTMSDRT